MWNGNSSLFTQYEALAYEAGENRFSRMVDPFRATAYVHCTASIAHVATIGCMSFDSNGFTRGTLCPWVEAVMATWGQGGGLPAGTCKPYPREDHSSCGRSCVLLGPHEQRLTYTDSAL